MIDALKSFLKGERAAPDDGATAETLHLAAAALLIHAAKMDGSFDKGERETIAHMLKARFELDDASLTALMDEAETKADDSVEFYGFTRELKNGFEHEERIAFMEMLWEVAYADGELHEYEANLMRRLSGLIYVTDRESGEARKRALKRLGQLD